MEKVYLLQHSYEINYEGISFNNTKIIGIYSTKEKAEDVVQRYKNIQGFNKYPISCFYIDEYQLDENQWTEGFVGSDELHEDFKSLTLLINKWLGIQKPVEESWEDNNYYQALCEVNNKVYLVKDAEGLAEYISSVWTDRFKEDPKTPDQCIDVAEKILNSLKLQ